jgi:hypothetical protein
MAKATLLPVNKPNGEGCRAIQPDQKLDVLSGIRSLDDSQTVESSSSISALSETSSGSQLDTFSIVTVSRCAT